MKPGALPLRARPRPMCQLCDYISQQPVPRLACLSTSTLQAPSIRRPLAQRNGAFLRIPARPFIATRSLEANGVDPEVDVNQPLPERIGALKTKLAEVEAHIQAVYNSNKVESEAVILAALRGLETVARQAIALRSRQPLPAKINVRLSSAGAILSGLAAEEEISNGNKKRTKSKTGTMSELPSPSYLSELAQDLLKFKTVFISPKVLGEYISLQRLLGRPRAIPEILYLYANKAIPQLGSSPPKFSKPAPKSYKQAIPDDICHEALTAAIEAKDLPLALDVIEHSVCTPAWKRGRFLKKFGFPGVIAACTPLGLYMIAQELSLYSGYLDPFSYKMYAFFGLMTYVTCTGTLGYIALTTHNWHHDRVRWQPGTGLMERYIREGERAALDRVAQAWGFKEMWKRGDEEGEDWEGLRQWCLIRSMMLDKADLMPGMNPGS